MEYYIYRDRKAFQSVAFDDRADAVALIALLKSGNAGYVWFMEDEDGVEVR